MSELTKPEPIMTVKRLRQLAGKEVAHLSDVQLEEAIAHLDFMADLFIERQKAREEVPQKRKPAN